MTELRVLLADKQPLVREGIKALIREESGLRLIGETDDGETAVHDAICLKPDVVIMDVSTPGMNGVDATRQLHAKAPQCRIVALTACVDSSHAALLLELGACGFVRKRAKTHILVDAIHAAARGEVYVDPSIAAGFVQSDLRRRGDPQSTTLTDREQAVLRFMAAGYCMKEIAARLHLSVKTIETYKARSMRKLKLENRVDVMRYATSQGWLLPA